VNIQDAVDVIESVSGFTDESTPVGEAWLEVLSFISTAPPDPVAPTDEEPDAFAIVQMRLDDLAGDQELMIYRWPNGEWSIDHTNPASSVQLGEVSGVYGSTGRILEDVVFALAAQLSAKNISEENLDG